MSHGRERWPFFGSTQLQSVQRWILECGSDGGIAREELILTGPQPTQLGLP